MQAGVGDPLIQKIRWLDELAKGKPDGQDFERCAAVWKCPKCGREFGRQDQDHYCVKPQSIDEYIAAQNEDVQLRLKEIRSIIHTAIPDAEERISWSMPTYWKGKNLIHFAASQKHIGLYPGDEAVAHFADELKDYNVSKGTVRFPYDAELPAELIHRLACWCYEAYGKHHQK